jgi:hypothetical protein
MNVRHRDKRPEQAVRVHVGAAGNGDSRLAGYVSPP